MSNRNHPNRAIGRDQARTIAGVAPCKQDIAFVILFTISPLGAVPTNDRPVTVSQQRESAAGANAHICGRFCHTLLSALEQTSMPVQAGIDECFPRRSRPATRSSHQPRKRSRSQSALSTGTVLEHGSFGGLKRCQRIDLPSRLLITTTRKSAAVAAVDLHKVHVAR